jgi:predicted polyphosphate/ATP-dependent NAD kinase
MALVGIIANPASGKDIRRLVGHATAVDNQGKVGIVRRALVGMGAAGVERVLIMPDRQGLGARALEGLRRSREAVPEATLLSMATDDDAADSERAAFSLRQAGAGCILVLGGDGTVRATSKGAGDLPLLAVSTGTNNVLPSFVEGTVAGLAAGAVARGLVPLERAALRHKWLELAINGASCDRALVDIGVLRGAFVGSRAVWRADELLQAVVTRAHPASIGISAIAGVLRPVTAGEPRGLALILGADAERRVLAAIGPGLVREVGVRAVRPVSVGERVDVDATRPCVLALDGERERVLYAGDEAQVILRGDGPWIVDSERVLAALAAEHFFERGAGASASA